MWYSADQRLLHGPATWNGKIGQWSSAIEIAILIAETIVYRLVLHRDR
jgi:hypothetical protein